MDTGGLMAGMGAMTIGIIAISCLATVGITIGAIVLARRLMKPNQEVLTTGVAGEATILRVWQTGMSVNDQPQVGMLLEVRVPGREPYQVEHKMVIPMWNIMQFQQGAVVPVKVDPNKPGKIALDVYA